LLAFGELDVERSMLARLWRVQCSLVSHLFRLAAGGQRRWWYENSFFCRKIINAMIVLVLVLGIENKHNGVEDEDDMKTG
jgi:hypothetical protein